jgi:hypothetical protein
MNFNLSATRIRESRRLDKKSKASTSYLQDTSLWHYVMTRMTEIVLSKETRSLAR